MFESAIYQERRRNLIQAIGDGLLLFPAAPLSPRTYPDNTYPYRQSAHFLYYVGIAEPGLFLLCDASQGTSTLYGSETTVDDVIWCGPTPSLEDKAARSGIDTIAPSGQLPDDLARAAKLDQAIHYLPPFQPQVTLELAALLDKTFNEIAGGSSAELTRAVTEQRLRKSDEEIDEIEEALTVTKKMFTEAMSQAHEGMTEADIAGLIQGIALRKDRQQTFLPITTIRGEVLHNESRTNVLQNGQMLLIDAGAESGKGYASDISRTVPVSTRFDERQRAIYDVVLSAHKAGIEATQPQTRFLNAHLRAAEQIARGLTDLGLMKGDPEEAVAAGAHALFFPHGLGHALGLDVHDMEDLGDVVGYGDELTRNPQFGLSFLRFARTLEPGFVVTIEPGIYFIPALIDQWAEESRLSDFIDYEKVNRYRGFGGIRIEDDVLVTKTGSRVLGPAIPSRVEDVEELRKTGGTN